MHVDRVSHSTKNSVFSANKIISLNNAFLLLATMSYLASIINVGAVEVVDTGLFSKKKYSLESDLECLENDLDCGFTPLRNQNYALCAGAVSFNFDDITYAKCRKKNGNSLGVTHSYPNGNVQTVNNIGNAPDNGSFMVSTYSPPDPNIYAAYSCNKSGSYAQCNGGLCFTGTTGKKFPTIGPVKNFEIICSCPIISSSNYHVMGPRKCPSTQKEYDNICASGSKKTTSADGFVIHIGSAGPIAVTSALNALYDKTFGTKSTMNVCKPISEEL